MPKPRKVLNAFTAEEIEEYVGLSVHMVDYLARHKYLIPTYKRGHVRGRVRYYSYRDLNIAYLVQKLREHGVELARLKKAVRELRKDGAWFRGLNPDRKSEPIQWLVTDGNDVLLTADDGFLDELRPNGQRSFAFVVTMDNVQQEVRARIPASKRAHYSIENKQLIFAKKRQPRKRGLAN
jgi:DNA-binding transcriptional MerR regulator